MWSFGCVALADMSGGPSVSEQERHPNRVHTEPILPHMYNEPEPTNKPACKLPPSAICESRSFGDHDPVLTVAPTQDPTYNQLLSQLPAYKESLNLRYPPICVRCAPDVEEDIEKKNQMARTTALGIWLKQTKQARSERKREQQQQASLGAFGMLRERWRTTVFPMLKWRIHGFLWFVTALSSLALNIMGELWNDIRWALY